MKVTITVEVDDRDRWAISRRHGWVKPASYKQVKAEVESLLKADLDEQRNECCEYHLEFGDDDKPCQGQP